MTFAKWFREYLRNDETAAFAEAVMLSDGKDLGRYVAIGQVGIEMVVPIGIGIAVDHYLGWQPWGVTVGTILGFSGGLLHLILVVRNLDKKDHADDSPGPKSGAP